MLETALSAERRDSLAYPALLGIAVTDAAGYSVMAPVLPSLAAATNAGPTVIGLLVASFSLAMLLGFALAGRGIRQGRTHEVLLVSLVLVALGTLGFIFAESLGAYFAARALMGLGSGGVWIAITFSTLERWPGQEYVCMSRIFAAYSVGGLLGPALGASGGTTSPFIAYLGLVVVLIPVAALIGRPRQRRRFGSSSGALRLPAFVLACGVLLVTWIAFGVLEGVLPLHFGTRIGQAPIAALLIATSLAVAGSAALASRFRPLAVTFVALPLVVVGISLAGAVSSVPLWIAALVLAGAGMGACNTGSTGILLAAVGIQRIVLPMVVWSQLGIIGYLIGPAAGGLTSEHLGYSWIGLIPFLGALGVIGVLAWARGSTVRGADPGADGRGRAGAP